MRLEFKQDPAKPMRAIVAVFDLAGFSTFCKHPDAALQIPRFITSVFSLLDDHSEDGPFFRLFQRAKQQFREPDFIKFTGDGALLLWVRDIDEDFETEACTAIVQGMRCFQLAYKERLPQLQAKLRVTGLPTHLRVGMTLGTVYPLCPPPSNLMHSPAPLDYVGYCINLAFRLQAHYRELGFIMSESIAPQIEGLNSVTAHNIQGSHEEAVLVFNDDLRREFLHDVARFRTKLKLVGG